MLETKLDLRAFLFPMGQIFLKQNKARDTRTILDNFMKKKGRGLLAKWAPYLHDVAFQHYVISNAYPSMHCDAHLMLTNKAARAETDGGDAGLAHPVDAVGGPSQHRLILKHPGVFGPAALRRIDHQRTLLERDAGQAAGND